MNYERGNKEDCTYWRILKSILGALESSVLLTDVKEVGVNKSEHSNNTAAILCAQETFMPT